MISSAIKISSINFRWEFRTDFYDIEFSVYRDGMSSEPEIPYDRFPSQLLRIQGEINCDQPGQCNNSLFLIFMLRKPKI